MFNSLDFSKLGEFQDPATHVGNSLIVNNADTRRCCYKLEKSLSPTIVNKDKRSYAVFAPFDANKDKYRKAVTQMKKAAQNYELENEKKLHDVLSKTEKRYDKIPRSLREKEMNKVKQ
jgi:hypothetical protein